MSESVMSASTKSGSAAAGRLALLREELRRCGLYGLLVPHADEYQNEYLPPCAERLAWLTGFTGSAGLVAALADKAALFVDGRYELQAQAQTDPAAFAIVRTRDMELSPWLAENVPAGARVGYDPRLHTASEVKALTATADRKGFALAAVEENLIDRLWRDRPSPPVGPLTLHPLRHAGRAAADKIADLQQALGKAGEDAALLIAPDAIAWLFNIRGSDVIHTPLCLSFAIAHAGEKPELFVDARKLSPAVASELSAIATLREPDALPARLAALGRGDGAEGRRVRVDLGRTPQWFVERLAGAGAKLVEGEDPCLLPKARKNAVEIEGARAAHRRDGAALCRFLAWLDASAASGRVDEIGAAQRLEAFRAATGELRDLSFAAISGAGPNGAIVHYRVTPQSNRRLEPGSLYLIDSGGQYPDGTTDVTRTVAIGTPDADMRRHFTLVLKGHIAIATARFPKGASGQALDAFARRALWQAGLDYDHGTGHGVGSYLSVHEGPQAIATRRSPTALEPGMIVSNEPGYYREGCYGIRIENLLLVTPPEAVPGGDRPMMGFETLTLAPIDRRLVAAERLSPDERQWLDAYHARVWREIGPLLDSDDERRWLGAAAAPITEEQS